MLPLLCVKLNLSPSPFPAPTPKLPISWKCVTLELIQVSFKTILTFPSALSTLTKLQDNILKEKNVPFPPLSDPIFPPLLVFSISNSSLQMNHCNCESSRIKRKGSETSPVVIPHAKEMHQPQQPINQIFIKHLEGSGRKRDHPGTSKQL